MKPLVAAFFAICLISPLAAHSTEQINGNVTRVLDGDTFVLESPKFSIKVRLHEVDAPETAKPNCLEQPGGENSKAFTESLVLNKNVTAICSGKSHERLVCDVFQGSVYLNQEIVRNGHAWVDPKYVVNKNFLNEQKEAQKSHKGLFAQKNPIPPWDWRSACKFKNRN